MELIALHVLGFVYILWLLFIVVMTLKNVWEDLSLFVKILAFPAVFLAVVMDITLNIAASLLFMDLPQEVMFTQRMGRYKYRVDSPKRTAVAKWLCKNMLDPFQAGGHCR